jgi:hypothetical protein
MTTHTAISVNAVPSFQSISRREALRP